jgi:hypothetical protein
MSIAICARCKTLFDPSITPVRFAEKLMCSWHPGEVVNTGTTDHRYDYAEVWKWTCCGKTEIGPIVSAGQGDIDHPPPRTPGCETGPHLTDNSVQLATQLATGIQALQDRLHELKALELKGVTGSEIFISYSHADSAFVDRLTRQFETDALKYWRDEKDILVGEVIDRAISEGIQRGSMFLVVLTPSSVLSPWVRREIDEAAHEVSEGRKIILPLFGCGLSPEQLPSRLRRFKGVDFNQDFDIGYRLLLRSIVGHMRRSEGASRNG